MRIFIWGTGKIANQVLDWIEVNEIYDVIGFIDNNDSKRRNTFRNRKVFGPDVLKTVKPDKIVILTDYYSEIKQQIIEMFPEMEILIENKNYFFKESILKRYKDDRNEEIREILECIQRNDLQVFNYDFVEEYKNLEIDVKYDINCEMYYVYHQGKKMYFAKSLDSVFLAREYYRELLIEQDNLSPHKYRSSGLDVDEGDIVVDVGAAEGIFSLEIIDRASKIYLIESDGGWIEALEETFKDYREKIVIIQRFVSSINERKSATLDWLIKEPVNFIKMDIEGNERDALLGARNLICCSTKLKCAICSYHSAFDEVFIKDVLNKYNLSCSTTAGYMWWLPNTLTKSCIPSKLCRGVVRGVKN